MESNSPAPKRIDGSDLSQLLPSRRCPHCGVSFDNAIASAVLRYLDVDESTQFTIRDPYEILWTVCTACEEPTVFIATNVDSETSPSYADVRMLFPKGFARRPPAKEVPPAMAEIYRQASAVLAASPMASAAMSRRCLQMLLHDHFQIKERDLAKEVEALLAKKMLPAHVAENVDAIRNFGNFGAHPIEDKATTSIVEVEPHEADWTLDVVEDLFGFCFVEPAKAKAKRDALNAKLQAAGKPPMK